MEKFRNPPNARASTMPKSADFFLDPQIPGRVYTPLKSGDIADAAGEFQKYGVLPEGQIPGDDRIESVSFECDLTDMVEKMLDCGLDDPIRH